MTALAQMAECSIPASAVKGLNSGQENERHVGPTTKVVKLLLEKKSKLWQNLKFRSTFKSFCMKT